MKLMLEHGAQFQEGNMPEPLPPAMENDFLNYIMAFEEQSRDPKYIKVFDRIERPNFFKQVTEIQDADIESDWEKLQDYLYEYHITLDVCSPNISTRELYRFVIEELFDYEMNDMNVPGMATNFIYDEFHPDPIYDNTRTATQDCINYILQKEPMEWTHNFRDRNLTLNNHFPITIKELTKLVNKFKLSYDDFLIKYITSNGCTVNENDSNVSGIYSVNATAGVHTYSLEGKWEVNFEKDLELGYWYINNVQITGINF